MIRYSLRGLLWSGGSVLCFLFCLVVAVSWGSVEISLLKVFQVICNQWFPFFEIDAATQAIIWELRLPRVLLAAVIGAALSVAGVIFQSLLQNHLADPYILGVSSGSACGAVIAIIIGLSQQGVALLAFGGSCLALTCVLYLAKSQSELTIHRIVLSGVVIQSFFGAIVTFFLSTSAEKMQTIVYWLLGSFSLAEWSDVSIAFTLFLIGFFLCFSFSRQLNILALGDQEAKYLGVSVSMIRFILLVMASLLTAVSVSVSGIIGFVGLVIPHIARLIIGTNHLQLLPFSAFCGAVFMMGADCLSRTLFAPQELSIGVVTAMVGAPFFAFLLKRSKKITQTFEND